MRQHERPEGSSLVQQFTCGPEDFYDYFGKDKAPVRQPTSSSTKALVGTPPNGQEADAAER
jgi:hypothetical protein